MLHLLLLLICFSRVRLCATPETAAHQAPRPWDSPGKSTVVGCHFLLQCMKVESESEVAQSCPTFCNPMDCSIPGSTVHGIFQARILEWVGIPLSRGSSQPRDRTHGSNPLQVDSCLHSFIHRLNHRGSPKEHTP